MLQKLERWVNFKVMAVKGKNGFWSFRLKLQMFSSVLEVEHSTEYLKRRTGYLVLIDPEFSYTWPFNRMKAIWFHSKKDERVKEKCSGTVLIEIRNRREDDARCGTSRYWLPCEVIPRQGHACYALLSKSWATAPVLQILWKSFEMARSQVLYHSMIILIPSWQHTASILKRPL